jgi:hypothetical protein
MLGWGDMKDPLDLEIADEIEKISMDIKNVLKKIETLYPRDKDHPETEEKNSIQGNPGS